jgi:hypothetical protein
MTDTGILEQLARYKWYHTIPLTNEISTPGLEGFMGNVRWATDLAAKREMRTRTLLDVGCRDCYASLRAEQNGAQVDAIDNDISAGARDFLLPYFKSAINLQHLSLYDLDPAKKQYDLIQFFGVLYHLRYPFRALRRLVECLHIGGEIMIEGGFLYDRTLQRVALLSCPIDDSPYDPSSCAFFNEVGIDQTMKHFGCEKTEGMLWLESDTKALDPSWYASVRRGFVAYRKTKNLTYAYWEPEGTHTIHSRAAYKTEDWQPEKA